MPNPLKTYIERVEQTQAVRITEDTVDDFRRQYEVSTFRFESNKGNVTFSFFWDIKANLSPLIVPWGAYVIVTYSRDPGQEKKTPHFEVVPKSDFEAKFVEDVFPFTSGEIYFLKNLYAEDMTRIRKSLSSNNLTPRD